MSIFRVFKRTNPVDLSYANERLGTQVAGYTFKKYWAIGHAQPNPGPDKVFVEFVYGLINSEGCIVTYKKDAFIVTTTANPDGTNKQFHYDDGTGAQLIKLNGVEDKPGNNEVKMCIPANSVDETANYLSRALDVFYDGSVGDTDKEAYLLGLLLLKRCR